MVVAEYITKVDLLQALNPIKKEMIAMEGDILQRINSMEKRILAEIRKAELRRNDVPALRQAS